MQGSEYRVSGLGCRVWCFRVSYTVWGLGFKEQGSGFRVSGLGCRVWCCRVSWTELRALSRVAFLKASSMPSVSGFGFRV